MKSKNGIPKNIISPQIPIDKEDGIPKTNMVSPTITAAFLRFHLSSSITYATGTSSKEIADVKAAIVSSKKNKAPTKFPAGIDPNTAGKVINISGGPASGANPKAKTAGIIINPANIAILKSAIDINTAEFGMSLLHPYPNLN